MGIHKHRFDQKNRRKGDHRVCSVARALDILGDRWAFLILRETFFGIQFYDRFRANLGIATNILSPRLKRLVENGIMDRRRDPVDSRRIKYKLTEKGRDLSCAAETARSPSMPERSPLKSTRKSGSINQVNVRSNAAMVSEGSGRTV